MKLILGSKVEDKVSGFKGIVVSRLEYLSGCIQYGVVARVSASNEIKDAQYFDEDRLTQIPGGIFIPVKTDGGPQRDAPK